MWLVAALAALVAVIAIAVSLSLRSGGDGSDHDVIGPPAGSVSTVPLDISGRPPPGSATWSAWPQALHDARHSGSSDLRGPTRGAVVWKRHLSDGATPAGPVLGRDGTVYVVDSDGTLHAVRPRDGKDRWTAETKTPVSGDLSTSALVLPDTDVVTAADDGLVAWTSGGRRSWGVRVPGSLTSPVTADGDRIYVGSRDGSVSAVDVTDRRARLAWTLDLAIDQSYGSVVTDGRGRIYQTSPAGIVAIDDHGDRASVAWRSDPHDGLVEVSPGLAPDGTVLLGTNGDHEWAYDETGRLRWKAPRHITYASPSVTQDGLAYVGEHNDRVHVFDVASGDEVGLFPTTVTKVSGKTRVWTSVVVDSEHNAYFGTRTHYLVGVRPDGTRIFTVDLGASTSSYPALTADHAAIIATDDGDLIKVR